MLVGVTAILFCFLLFSAWAETPGEPGAPAEYEGRGIP
jgi:hypothetical protein